MRVLWCAVMAYASAAVVHADGGEAEEEPQIVRVSRMSHEGIWYLVDKANGVVYANDQANPEVLGSYTNAGGLELHDDEDFGEDAFADAEQEEGGGGGGASPFGGGEQGDDTCVEGPDGEKKGNCGCGAVKREGGAPVPDAPSKYDPASQTGDGELDPAMVSLPGGEFSFGSNAGFFPEDGEGPARKVTIDGFRIGKHEVSNARFEVFTQATGYVTEAERFGNSFVVEQFVSKKESAKITSAVAAAPWWVPVDLSDWAHPEGRDSNLTSRGDRLNHPAVHVSYNDAAAFCAWSVEGGRLPTEAEWEFAAAGGKENRKFPWGNKLTVKGKANMNTWQTEIEDKFMKDKNIFKHSYLPTQDGHNFFSSKNTAADGWELTAPVDAYLPNKYGLYNTVGNVWEWTADWQIEDRTQLPSHNPKSLHPDQRNNKVKKGGSYMCHQFTCYRYRIAARMFITPDSSASNVGFRCAADALP